MKNLQSILIAVGAIAIFWIISSEKVSSALLLPVMGAFCLLYGGLTLLNARKNPDIDFDNKIILLEFLLGGFLLVIGLIELFHVEMNQMFWNCALMLIIVVGILWGFLRRRK